MAKKRPKPKAAAADRHLYTVVTFRPAKALRAAVEALAEAERRSLALMVEILLEEALQQRKLWPPPAEQED
jgi:hypothetical protein